MRRWITGLVVVVVTLTGITVGALWGASIELGWTPPPESDVWYMNVYSAHELEGPWGLVGDGTAEYFGLWYENAEGRQVRDTIRTSATLADPNVHFIDEDVEIDQPYYYFITAVDRAGNESTSSTVASTVVVPHDPTPDAPAGLVVVVRIPDSSGTVHHVTIILPPEIVTEEVSQ